MMKRFYLYKKDKREYLPVEDKSKNEKAKQILDKMFDGESKYKIPEKFKLKRESVALFQTKGNLESVSSLFIIDENTTYDLSNKLNELTSKEWLAETVTVFTQKGLGANSKDAQIEKQHPAPFSFQDVGRLINFFTKSGDLVLDPFNGVASTLKACAFNNRRGIGIELNRKYYELSLQRLDIEVPDSIPGKQLQQVVLGDSLVEVGNIPNESVDLIITSPPYWNILDTVDHKVKQTRIANELDVKYSFESNDLANIENYETFLDTLASFFSKCSRLLKKGKHLVIIVSDFRKKEKYFVFHADLASAIEKSNQYKLKGIKILYQRHKSIFPYGYPFSFVPNMHHQNVLIFQKV